MKTIKISVQVRFYSFFTFIRLNFDIFTIFCYPSQSVHLENRFFHDNFFVQTSIAVEFLRCGLVTGDLNRFLKRLIFFTRYIYFYVSIRLQTRLYARQHYSKLINNHFLYYTYFHIKVIDGNN